MTIAVALLALVALASTMTYTGFLVIGVLAEYLGTGRFLAGLLLAAVFARFPRISQGKWRTVGLLPKSARRPVMMGILGLCLWTFLARGVYVPALFFGCAAAFLLTFPWIRRAVVGRVISSVFNSGGDRNGQGRFDSTVIDGEFRERKD